ncbi:MAG: family 43 glycosylhydrolase [Akkermansiaceae bacterium]|nr:family 43 glycosylhydrolase [Akkermansiaceae bacterium]
MKHLARLKRKVFLSLFLTAVVANAAPRISMGLGYYAVLPNKLLLTSIVTGEGTNSVDCLWTKQSGPGEIVFERPRAAITWATAAVPGKYVLKLRATHGDETTEATTTVNVYDIPDRFGNPILPGMFPDPHILCDQDTFYIFATSMENEAGAYGRASVWMSKDFVNWEMRLTDWPVFGKFGGDIWAPDILKRGNRYYQFITRSGGYDTWIAVADHPLGPWKNLREDNTPIVSGGGKAGRIVAAYNMDSQPFIDDDGQAYMYWGWSEAMAARLTPDLKNIDGEVHFLKGTKWLPKGGDLPQSLTVDLGESMQITRIVTCPEFRHVEYGYRIELSEDGQSWKTFADRSTNRTEKAGEGYVDQGEGRGRQVRISMNYCSGNWAGLYSFDVFSGSELVSRGKPATASSIRGEGSEPGNAVDASNGPQLADFVEGSYMIKRDGTYYLLYSSGALHDGSYSVHYATAKHPFGPFTAPVNNVVLKSNGDLTTKGPGHNSVLKFKNDYYIVYHQHNQPHEGAKGVFRQTCADRMEFGADGTIKQVVPTQTGVGALLPLVQQGNDVARGKYASATSVRSGNYAAEYALDHNNASLWSAATNTYPQSLTVDLGGTFEVGRIETSFEYPTLAYKYAIETSLDGKAWSLFADQTAEFPIAVCPQQDTGQVKAGFVRITITGCQRPENGAGIYNLKVFQP